MPFEVGIIDSWSLQAVQLCDFFTAFSFLGQVVKKLDSFKIGSFKVGLLSQVLWLEGRARKLRTFEKKDYSDNYGI